jgi:uncharacterized membrane protein YfcA
MDMTLLYPVSGFAIGMLVGLTGVGGGSLMTPLLVLAFGIHPAVAVGTDLLQVSLTKAVGSLLHGLRHTVDWRIVGMLATGSLPATALALVLLSRIDLHGASSQRMISDVLGTTLVLTGVVLLLRRQMLNLFGAWAERISPARRMLLTVAAGALVGFLVTLTSVGAGAIGTTILVLLYARLPMARIVGSDIAHAVPLTLLAGIGHWALGSIDWHLLGSLLTGSLPGILIGSYLATRLPDMVLRSLLAVTMAVVGTRMLV